MRALRWIGIGVLSLAGVLLVATIAIYIASSIRINKAYQIADRADPYPQRCRQHRARPAFGDDDWAM